MCVCVDLSLSLSLSLGSSWLSWKKKDIFFVIFLMKRLDVRFLKRGEGEVSTQDEKENKRIVV